MRSPHETGFVGPRPAPPPCPSCGSKMQLAVVDPNGSKYTNLDLWSYRCEPCGQGSATTWRTGTSRPPQLAASSLTTDRAQKNPRSIASRRRRRCSGSLCWMSAFAPLLGRSGHQVRLLGMQPSRFAARNAAVGRGRSVRVSPRQTRMPSISPVHGELRGPRSQPSTAGPLSSAKRDRDYLL